jgi:hypothetical protein
MTLDDLKTELRSVLRDPTVENSFTTWLNQAVTEISAEYELPVLRLRQPAVLTTTTADYLYDIADAVHPLGYLYQKRVFKVTSAQFQQGFGLEPDPRWLDDTDPGRTQIGDSVMRVAIEGDQISVFPRASDSLSLWFYRKPVAMVAGTDEPDGIPDPYCRRVLVPHVVLWAFRNYPDELAYGTPGNETKMLVLWQGRLNAGLYGNGVEIGLMQYITKAQRVGTPRLRGAPMGSGLGGRWW